MRNILGVPAGSLLSSVLTALVATSAFTTGAVLEIGVAFVPVIDKANLVLLLAFYGSIIVLLVQVARAIWAYATRGVDSAIITFGHMEREGRRRTYSELRQKAAFLKRLPKRLALLSAVLVFVIAVAFLVFSWASVRPYLTVSGGDHLLTWTFGGLFGVALLFGVGNGGTPSQRVRFRLVRPTLLAALNILFLLVSFLAGGYWIRVLDEVGPRLVVNFVDDRPSTLAAVAFPASEGLIVFFVEKDGPSYLPWDQISSLDGDKSPASDQLPTGENAPK